MRRLRFFVKKNKEVLLIIGLPLVVTSTVAAFVYIPSLFQNPQYDFVYLECANNIYSCSTQSYGVSAAGKLEEQDIYIGGDSSVNSNAREKLDIFYYSVNEGVSKKITLQEAQAYDLDSSSKSPDGYKLSARTSYSNLLFDPGNSDYTVRLVKDNDVHTTDIGTDGYYWRGRFIGWINE